MQPSAPRPCARHTVILSRRLTFVLLALGTERSLLEIRQKCTEVAYGDARLALQALEPNVTYSLDAFVEAQEEQAESIVVELATFNKQTLASVKRACTDTLAALEEKLVSSGGFGGGDDMEDAGRTGNKWAQARDPANTPAAKFSYTVLAAKRAEHRKLHHFIRLADYVIRDTLHGMVVSSASDVLDFMQLPRELQSVESMQAAIDDTGDPEPVPEDGPTSPAAAAAAAAAAAIAEESATEVVISPVFEIEILAEGSSLTFSPSQQDFRRELDKMLSSFIITVSSVPNLSSEKVLKPFTSLIEGEIGVMHDDALEEMVSTDTKYVQLVKDVRTTLADAFEQAELCKEIFEPFLDIVRENDLLDIIEVEQQAKQGEKSLDDFSDDMEQYHQQEVMIGSLPTEALLSLIKLNSEQLRESFLPSPTACLQAIEQLLPVLGAAKVRALLDDINDGNTQLGKAMDTVEDFCIYLDFLEDIQSRQDDMYQAFEEVELHYELMEQHGIEVPEHQMAEYRSLLNEYGNLKGAIDLSESRKTDDIAEFTVLLDKKIKNLAEETQRAANEAADDMFLQYTPTGMHPDSPVMQQLKGLDDEADSLKEMSAEVQAQQKMFNKHDSNSTGQITRFDELKKTVDDIKLKKNLWDSLREFGEQTELWAKTKFAELDAEEMAASVQRYNKVVMAAERTLPINNVVPELKRAVETYKGTVPVVTDLRNPALKLRHWDKIEAIVGKPIDRENPDLFTLNTLLDLHVQLYKEQIMVVSTEATQEGMLEEMLLKVTETWADTEFVMNPYKDQKDTYILGGIDDIIAQLEDSMTTMGQITASRFVGGIREKVEDMETSLNVFSETLDEWLQAQRNWMYLESIFCAQDIQRQLPQESKLFFDVDKTWRAVMKTSRDTANAFKSCTSSGVKETFEKANEIMDRVQNSLEDYLEKKRMAFPRFYFLSNDELLEILAQTRNPEAVQPHISKCFDQIKALDFGGGDRPPTNDHRIYAMKSPQGEVVDFGPTLKARGDVETWLTATEKEMRSSLNALMKVAVKDHEAKAREQWILDHPAQVVLTVAQIYWTRGILDCYTEADPLNGLRGFADQCRAQLIGLTKLVQGSLTKLERLSIAALITLDVHGRDVADMMVADGTTKDSDFIWQMQLRFYWDEDEDSSLVRQTNARFWYGNEYLGAQPRLVVTPMTDRCYMTLTGALHLKLGGAPAGPAGTGKTETTKDLAKGLGINCVVFNCGENLDHKFMGKFFKGLCQCGAWACFDEFNRINIEVLSVVAQQMISIQNALRKIPSGEAQSTFYFEGKEIKIIETFGCFITMNPGYAGRTELPDNLKVLFRPVSMMIPDYGMVAEVMLFSEGFTDAKVLSRKMVKLYKLSSEQLSQQGHYDFGMRAVKSVLVMAGALMRSSPGVHEDVTLIRAMRDSNIPKFLIDDVILFQALISDLFPGVAVPEQTDEELRNAIEAATMDSGLQLQASCILKVLQLYDTLNVRFGVMLVGPTGGGKTSCYQSLQRAMTALRQSGSTNPEMQMVHTYILNPKCISMGELYGEFNEITSEWKDGLGSGLMRQAVSETTDDRKWIVFDGPVDAVWIESMNTVLDDNRTLCLPNGERIKLNGETMRTLFEVEDLSEASPATVSRCGMVWIAPEDLGWRPYVKTWLAGLHKSFTEDLKANLWKLFDDHVDNGLAFYRENCPENIPTVDINLVASLCDLMTSVTNLELGGKDIDWVSDPERTDETIGLLFAFCYVWSIGGNTTAAGMDAFDEFCRNEFEESVPSIPPTSTLYEMFVDVKHQTMDEWESVVPNFEYTPGSSYLSILVPTVDTVRYSFLLDTCLDVGKSVLFTGESGAGKTAIVQDLLSKNAKSKNTVPVSVVFSAQTSSVQTQTMIEGKLEKRRKTIFGAPPGKKMVLFVDDVNMPAREVYGAQPPVELLRQFQDFSGFYDREKWFWKEVVDVNLVCACGPPGGGRNPVTPRFIRHFNVLCIPPGSGDVLRSIFSSILGGFLEKDFVKDVSLLTPRIVKSTVELYTRISNDLLPTPAKTHYTFNLRDISKTFQGILMVTPENCPDAKTMIRLWMHECMRVFHDRLIDEEGKTYLKELLLDLVAVNFNQSWDYEETFLNGHILFGDYLKQGAQGPDRVYEEIRDLKGLATILDDYQFEYNNTSPNQMNLVFFTDAMEHISRVARVLRLEKGNAMLVGVGGSGKQSCTRLASSMAEYKCWEIELKKGYDVNMFREDLKGLFELAGVGGTPVTFMLVDTQIVDESMLEDVNNILNTGEVPGMYPSDEKEAIMADMRSVCEELGLSPSKEMCWQTFIERVKSNLHIVLCMSPVGDAFRRRCRLFPSLINCTTIDWFTRWPDDALLSVAEKSFESEDLGSAELRTAVAKMCVRVHQSTQNLADEFLEELHRHYYITPKSYLDMIALYVEALREKRSEKENARSRLENGLSKLHECNEKVDDMETTLTALAPVLKEKGEATEVLLVQVSADQAAAEEMAVVVNKEAAEAKAKATEVQAIKDDAQQDLDKALPALNSAVSALNALNKNDINEIKSFKKPPDLVQTTMDAVCILLEAPTGWDSAKKVLGNQSFLKTLIDYDKDSIQEPVLKKLQKYVNNEDFTPAVVGKVSKAAKSLCMWCCAMDTYSKVAKTVEPKRRALNEAESQLNEVMAALKLKEDTLAQVEANVAGLQAQLQAAQDEKQRLEDEASLTEARLRRAGKLTGALADEAERWGIEVQDLTAQSKLLVGDVFISSACISYFGAFNGTYRDRITATWLAGCQELSIPTADDFSLMSVLGDPVMIREWGVQGLPSDQVSIDSGILVTRAKRWPLMIDPQQQANKWIKNMEQKSGLRPIKMSEDNFLRTLEFSIRVGNPVLCEDVGNEVDPALEPVLLKQVVKQAGGLILRLGETDVPYDENFRFYMTSKLANPHYMPELCIKVTLINFTVTMDGLENQLLADVVRKERPELEETKDKLVVSMANDAKQLKELEDRTLKLLESSEGNILDNEPLINTLNNSKLTSGVIKQRVAEAEKTELEINAAREEYRPVATRSSLLYFVIADLGRLDPMYQYSLSYFQQLFKYCIDVSEKADSVQNRLQILMDYISYFVYLQVSRGLFAQHRLVFSFLICTAIMRHSSSINDAEWNFLLRGCGAQTGKLELGPCPVAPWLSAKAWELLNGLQRLIPARFDGFVASFEENLEDWGAWAAAAAPHTEQLPGPWGDDADDNDKFLPGFAQMLVLKALKPEKLPAAMSKLVADNMGQRFIEIPPLMLEHVYGDTSPTVPVVFILSTGADPTSMLLTFAEDQGFTSRLDIISLGSGQGPKAEQIIVKAKKDGNWVCLQNCHLATSWMPTMERLIADLQASTSQLHPDFRLWLMSMPSKDFPVATLQSSIKLTNEPPKGLRANMLGTLGTLKEDYFESCSKPGPWKKLVYGLAFFHAMIQERRKFGPLGWNVGYEFNNSDLDCSMATLKMFLEEQDEIPWESLVYVTGQINYGGRITDDQDRRCLMTILANYYTPAIIADDYKFSESGTYYVPTEGPMQSYINYTQALPMEEAPEVFGMHTNALIAFDLAESNKIIDTVLSIQPRVRSGGGESEEAGPEQIVAELAAEMERTMPTDLPLPSQVDVCCPGLFDRDPETGQMDSLATVLSQEVDRFNGLMAVLRSTLVELQRAIRGLIVMSGELEEMFNAFLNNQVPPKWMAAAYPSLKPLASWVADLQARMVFMHTWTREGPPKSFSLPSIFFTQGFLTGMLQKHARKHIIPIDSLEYGFAVTDFKQAEEVEEAAADGCYVHGLFVEAATWDDDTKQLLPALPGAMYASLPLVLFLPRPVGENKAAELSAYECPLYRTSVRKGVLTTTGASSNYVLDIRLPIQREASFFVLQGTAALCSLDD